LFKALLLLADNAKRNGLSELDFTGEGHQLGTFETVKTKGSEKEEMTFVLNFSGVKDVLFGLLENGYSLKYTFKNGILMFFEVIVQVNSTDEYVYRYLIKQKTHYAYGRINLDLILNVVGLSNVVINKNMLRKELHSFDKENVELFLDDLNEYVKWEASNTIEEDRNYGAYDVFKSDYIMNVDENFKSIIYSSATLKEMLNDYFRTDISDEYKDYVDIIGKKLYFKEIFQKSFYDFLIKLLEKEMELFNKLIEKSALKLDYLEAVRANTRRLYNFRSDGTNFNQLLQQFLNFKKYSFDDQFEGKGEAIHFFKKWLANFNIATDIEVTNVEGAMNKIALIRKNGEKVNLADVGYGMTQLLPILIKVLSFSYKMEAIFYGKGIIANEINHPNGRLLLLEEPETNLHPKLQSLLADFLVDVAKEFHITLLVETHSEYLIRKLQYLTAKKEITPADTAIYYFYDPENVPAGKKQVERIRIETDGSLDKDFGTGFFDEADNLAIDLFNITKAQRN
jgi:predicted ATPase